ncbi:unnamed protein product [Anisakis simplex]|uniref:Ig-like domain-containing protein n=1 Tax=Anisakis simplex TaxID=6269 RepID=A0A0M3KE78_ANISI|nr:unnamed protein product [Anisakis simplex]
MLRFFFRCQGRTQSSDDLLPIKAAHFVRNSDQEILPAFISNNRAILVFNSTTLHSVGKYRCEITTEDDQHIWGWLFVNMRPVFHANSSKIYEFDKDDHFHIKSLAVRATEGETVLLNCPVIGYPKPTVEWLKDNVPVGGLSFVLFH